MAAEYAYPHEVPHRRPITLSRLGPIFVLCTFFEGIAGAAVLHKKGLGARRIVGHRLGGDGFFTLHDAGLFRPDKNVGNFGNIERLRCIS